ncbi:uncharacterized [Tachysurus ichikawai]
MEEEFPSKESCDNRQNPHQYLQDVPPSAWILIQYEGETVSHNYYVCFRLAVGYGVFSEDEEVEEGDEVGYEQAQPRVLEIITEAYTYLHSSNPRRPPASSKKRDREQ